jgi:hypothetical protein
MNLNYSYIFAPDYTSPLLFLLSIGVKDLHHLAFSAPKIGKLATFPTTPILQFQSTLPTPYGLSNCGF